MQPSAQGRLGWIPVQYGTVLGGGAPSLTAAEGVHPAGFWAIAHFRSGLCETYPDFVFGIEAEDGATVCRIVLLKTKGLHLQGQDTRYEQNLLASLDVAFGDEHAGLRCRRPRPMRLRRQLGAGGPATSGGGWSKKCSATSSASVAGISAIGCTMPATVGTTIRNRRSDQL